MLLQAIGVIVLALTLFFIGMYLGYRIGTGAIRDDLDRVTPPRLPRFTKEEEETSGSVAPLTAAEQDPERQKLIAAQQRLLS